MNGRGRFRTVAFTVVATVAILAALIPPATRAADDKVLQRIRGTIGYQTAASAPLTTVVGKFLLPDDYFAITHAQSAALLTLPDSSIVGLGENTDVQVGAFNQTAAGPGSTVTVNGGTLRFDIRRPAGGAANYRFTTTTSQIAIRGTIGLLSFIDGNTTVACLVCAADSVTVTVGTQTFSVLSGQLLTVSAAGAVATAPLTGTALSTFATAEVSTSVESGTTAATAGVVPATSGAASGALAAAAVGAGVISGVAIAASKNGSPASGQTAAPFNPPPTPSPTPTPTLAPTATPSATFSVTSKTRPSAAPAIAPAPGPAAPALQTPRLRP